MSKENNNFSKIINYGWESNSWPNFYVWNKYQENFIKSLPNKANTKIVGPILFQDQKNVNTFLFKRKKGKSIALFDITIFRNYLYQTEGHLTNYENPDMAIKFINDILEICIQLNINIFYKSKRKFSKNVHPKYRSFINNISNKNFHFLDPNISSIFLIKNTNGCISFPYTSTSVLAKLNNKKTCFYDPSGDLQTIINQTSKIMVIQSKSDLYKWIKEL